MRFRPPDWIIYIGALLLILWGAGLFRERADAPEALPDRPEIADAPVLPGPSPLDPEVLVEVGPPTSGIGTAFAVSADGYWLTARHVVEGCKTVGLEIERGRISPVSSVQWSESADIALLKTDRAPRSLAMRIDDKFRDSEPGFHFGFLQDRPGEAASRVIGRHRLRNTGRINFEAPVVTWAEIGRTRGLFGSLGGISGGPAFDAKGAVVGVTIAESARRGRIFTASPQSITAFLQEKSVLPVGASAGPITAENYGETADRLRHDLAVAKVVCYAP